MFRTLLIKEIHDSFLSLRFTVALLLCLVLVPLGMYTNYKDYQKRLSSYEQAAGLYEREHPRERHLSSGSQAFRRPAALSVISIGLEYFFPTTIHFEPREGISFSNDRGMDNPQSLLLGKIDLLFIVSVVISLLAILFSFNSISGEKESGTLKLMLSNVVPRHVVLIAKLIGNYVVLFIPFLLSLLTGILILVFSGSAFIFSGDSLVYFLLILLASMLLIAVFFNLGLLVSALTHRSSTAIVILLLLWVMSALAYPRISTMVAEAMYPVKTEMVFSMEKNALLHDLEEEERAEYSALWKSIGGENTRPMTSPDTSSWDDQTARFMAERVAIQKRYEERVRTSVADLEREYDNEKQRQSDIAMNISRVSPVSCYMYAVSSLAGTGLNVESGLKEDAYRFYEHLKRTVYSQVFIVKLTGSTSDFSTFPENNPAPQFQQAGRSLDSVIRDSSLDLLLLCLFNVLLFAGAFVAFLRYDVR
ncbi:ABC transporter permease subunit [bacterium]|nr:ABC transporter permease subunit [bacterium]